ncbi:hypothetical protein Btru_013230 [Bulinus truncatus]|nr:hypothetical protein Btru_013230 [Bulinus truncatus]
MASGINEHHEALRKQRFINRRTHLQKQFLEKLKNSPEEVTNFSLDKGTYKNTNESPEAINSLELENLYRKYNAAETEEEKKTIKQHIDYLTYSAKIKGRLNSTNYKQQW